MAESEDRGTDWFGNDPTPHTVVLTQGTIDAAISTLDDTASDEREPQRYREWFQHAAEELRRATTVTDAG